MRTADILKSMFKHASVGVCMLIPTSFNLKTGCINGTTGCTFCREIAIRQYADFMTEPDPIREDHARRHKANKSIVQAKARVIFPGLNKDMFDAIISGKTLKTMHLIEKELGMPRTFPVELFASDKSLFHNRKVMFVGSNKWFRSSHTMSLWLLILRLGLRAPEFTGKTIADLEKLAKSYPKKANGANSANTDKAYVKATFHSWMPLMKNLNVIFSPKVLWSNRFNYDKMHVEPPANMYKGNISGEGILKLVGDSRHIGAPKFKEILAGATGKSK